MANRYWVGGTGNWSDTNKWSASSGGTGGASVPTSVDSVFFDSASNATAYTVTVDVSTSSCLNFNMAGPASGQVTFTGTADLNIYGGMDLTGGTVGINWTHTGRLYFSTNASVTLNTNGVTITSIVWLSSSVGTYTLTSALTVSGSINLSFSSGATFSTGASSFSITCNNINILYAATYNFGSSTITLGSSFGWSVKTGVTVNASNTTIVYPVDKSTGYGGPMFEGGNNTYGNLTLSYTAGNSNNEEQKFIITGNNTFTGTVSIVGPAAAGFKIIQFDGRQTFNGPFTVSSTAGNRRIAISSRYSGQRASLTFNSTATLTDVDFQDIAVTGTSAPISGTRIGDRGGNSGITFSTPKTVYWNLAAGGNWNATAWATTSGGAVSDNNFPLPQDHAVIQNTGLNTSATITFNDFQHIGTLDASTRTNAMTLAVGTFTVYVHGNLRYTQTMTGGGTVIMCGRSPQLLRNSGTATAIIFRIDSPGGVVKMEGAFNCYGLNFISGTFDTDGFTLSPAYMFAAQQFPCKIFLRNSTVSLTTQASTGTNNWIAFEDTKNISNTLSNVILNAGTSTVNIPSYTGAGNIAKVNFGGYNWYNVNFNGTDLNDVQITGNSSTFNNLTFGAPASTGLKRYLIDADNMSVNGTLTATGATVIRRIMLLTPSSGPTYSAVTRAITTTAVTIKAAAVSLADVDFRDIIGGGAATWTGTRLGDCGGNSNITFDAPKTVYWNLTGTQAISATAWALTSGGTPALNNFPLAQDTMVINNTGAATTINFSTGPWNFGTFDVSTRTTAVTLSVTVATPSVSPNFYGDFKLGTGVTWTSTAGGINLCGRSGTNVITSNGRTINTLITMDAVNGKYTLTDALTTNNGLLIYNGIFDASTFNTTISYLNFYTSAVSKGAGVYMGSGTWTLTGTSTLWGLTLAGGDISYLDFDKGTANIVASDASTTSKTFSYITCNKLTLSGNATCTYDFINTNFIGELASTKTVAFTITLSTTSTQFFGTWSVTGTLGNLVTVTTRTANTQCRLGLGSTTSGIDYLSVSWVNMYSAGAAGYATQMNFGQFFVGANSTNGGNNTEVYFTATPAARTLYWVGGTGNWSDANKWATASGGGGGAGPPNMIDNVVFDSASNGTSYTVTVDTDYARCNNFTMDGPATGTVTWAGSSILRIAGNFSLTGGTAKINRTYTGPIIFVGTGTRTINYNGVTTTSVVFNAGMIVNATDATWTLTSGMTVGSGSFTQLYCGKLDTAGFALSTGYLWFENSTNSGVPLRCRPCTLTLGASTISLTSAVGFDTNPIINFGSTSTLPALKNFTLQANTSTIAYTGGSYGGKFYFSNGTFYNVTFSNQGIFSSSSYLFFHDNTTFNNLTLEGPSASGTYRYIMGPTVSTDPTVSLTVNGTLTARGKSDLGNWRVILWSGYGTDNDWLLYPRRYITTINAAAVTLRDVDFCGITCSGAATWSGTRIGDFGGNAGLVPSTPKTVYVGSAASTSVYDFVFATSSGGAASANNYPLAQDTIIIDNSSSVASSRIDMYNYINPVATFDSSLRTSGLTINCYNYGFYVHRDFKLGTGITFTSTGSGYVKFVGSNTNQTITTNGVGLANLDVYIHNMAANGYGYSVILNGALTANAVLHSYGILDSNNYNITASYYFANYITSAKVAGGGYSNGQYLQLVLKNSNMTLTSNGSTGFAMYTIATNSNTGISDYGYTDVSNSTLTISNATNSANVQIFTGGVKFGKLVLAGTGTNQTFTMGSTIQRYGEITSSRSSAYTLNVSSKLVEVDKFTATGSSSVAFTILGAYTTADGAGILRKIGAPVRNIDYITVNGASLEGDTQKTWYIGGNSAVTSSLWGGANVGGVGVYSKFAVPKQGSMGNFFQ